MNYILKGMPLNKLQDFMISHGYPKYRAQQIYHWMYQKSVIHASEMNNLPLNLQSFLESN